MTRHRAGPIETIARALTGTDGPAQITAITSRVWRVMTTSRSAIVKVFAPTEHRAYRRELAGADAARDTIGAWVPARLDHGTTVHGHSYVAYADIPGTDLNTARAAGTVTRGQALGLLGNVLHRLHRPASPSAASTCHRDVAIATDLLTTQRSHHTALLIAHDEPDLARILSDVVHRLQSTLSVRYDTVLCHGDLHYSNVIGKPTATDLEVQGVIDYESVILAAPEYDLAKTIVVCSAYPRRAQSLLLASYGHDIDPAVLDDLVTYHTLEGWLWAALVENRARHLWAPRLRTALDMRA